MRTAMIDEYARKLEASLGKIRRPVDEDALQQLFKDKDYTGMVGFIKRSMQVECRVRLGIVKSDGDNAAWIEYQDPTPMAGTPAFKRMLATMYLRKPFLELGAFDSVVYGISHEFAHIVLDSIRHPLSREEVAVDLTAMLLGYRDLYVTGCQHYEKSELALPNSDFGRLAGKIIKKIFGEDDLTVTTHKFGYLSYEEVHYAARRMTCS